MKLSDYIFCEDIRNEQGNKISLMGIFHDRIIINAPEGVTVAWPIQMRIAIFLRVSFDEGEERPDRFKFVLNLNRNKLVEVTGTIKTEGALNMANIAIRGEGLPIEPGEIGFGLSLSTASKEVFQKEIKKAIIVHAGKS